MNPLSGKGMRGPVLWVVYGLVLVLWLTGAWYITGSIFESRSNALIREKFQLITLRVDNVAEAFAHNLNEVHGIPALIASDREVLRVLNRFNSVKFASTLSAEQRKSLLRGDRELEALNNHLKLIDDLLGSDVLYVITAQGDTIASSNFDKPDSFLGANFANRDYFRTAMTGQQGHQYAVGKVSKIPGLYFSVPITDNGHIVGVAVVKINIPVLAHWVRQADAFVTDEYGVVILASDERMDMRALPGATVFSLTSEERLARYRRDDFSVIGVNAWPAEFAEPLFQIDNEDAPVLLQDKLLDEERIRIHVFSRLPEVVTYAHDRLSHFLVLGLSGALAIFFGAARLALRRIRKKAREEQRIAATAFETEEGIMITDRDAVILKVNHAFTRLTGYSPEEVIGKSPALLQSGRQDKAFYRAMWETLGREKYWKGEIWNRRKNGEVYPEWLTITAVSDSKGVVTHYVGVFSDITQRKLTEQRISFLAYHDKLTDLPNRSLFYDRMSRAMSQTRRMDRHFALLLLDLDGFKAVNDEFGHEAGDEVIKASAQRLLTCVRDVDTVARMGGDEFAIILSEVKSPEDISGIARKIIQRITSPVSLFDGRVCSVGVSIGIAIHPDDGEEIDRLIRAADAAMYASKAAGKGTYSFAAGKVASDVPDRPWIVLDEPYLLGVPEMDVQHRRLVERLNDLNLMVRNIEPQEVILQTFDALIEEVGTHFHDEERLMDKCGFDKHLHQQEHERLIAEAGSLREELIMGGESVVLQTLKSWLMNHVLNSDRAFANFYKESASRRTA
jgi:diguanylate cyclase (GGDEF)-like protein/hemerythrin-like metal-binding protein/PAS domain S-box-containing protein